LLPQVLEIGAGEPFVAEILYRLGYEVWIADPYDGSGKGPIELERYRKECPNLHFVRSQFNDDIAGLAENSLDCVYSISVLEHIPDPALRSVFKGVKRYLRPDGIHIHAVDYVHKGNGADQCMAHLPKWYAVPVSPWPN
jgi:2-polyprenyl-3-methyl-5-hydroxy-6-metoxy-1,4-benzoquinol methylase